MSKFARQFHDKAARVNPAAPSVSKWNGVRNLLAEEVGKPPAEFYVSTISKPGNVTVRFDQSDEARNAPVLVGMYTKASELDRATKRLAQLANERGCRGVMAAAENPWRIVAVMVSSPKDQLAIDITASFPSAAVLLI